MKNKNSDGKIITAGKNKDCAQAPGGYYQGRSVGTAT